jgi:hypothetical protein
VALIAGEQASGGEIRDGDGRLIVVGPGGVGISGGGGGTASTVALDAPTLAALETISVANLLNPHPVSIATALDISDRTARLLGHVTVDNFPATQAVSGSVNVDNFPATQTVAGTVTANAGTGPFPVSDNGGSLTVDGTVGVDNFPASQNVADGGGSLTVDTPQLPAALVGSRLDVNLGAVGSGLVLPIVGSAPAQSTATWTSATALNTALTYTGLAPYGAVTIGVTVPSTVTAGAVTIETSLDGTNWTQAGSVRVDNSFAENVVPLAFWPGTNGTRQYLVSLDALTQVRVRLSTVIVGTGNVTVIIAPAQQGVEPLVAQRSRKVATYRALYRAAARPYRLSNLFVANTRKQYATIHHAATATRTVKLRRVAIGLDSVNPAAIFSADLVRITTAPATGNPAITPARATQADAAAEATCLALPTTAATEDAAVYSSLMWNVGTTGAGSTVSPMPPIQWWDLLGISAGFDDEAKQPEIRAGVLEGFAVTLDLNAASTLTGYVMIEFTEETP